MKVISVLAVASTMVVSAIAAPSAGFAQTCERTVSIAPQVSAGEGAGKLIFAVYSGGCAAAGGVGYEVVSGSATVGVDFVLPRGVLHWVAGDNAIKTITATILQDAKAEADLEHFRIQLVDPSPDVLIKHGSAQGRILDDDGPTPRGAVDDDLCTGLLALQGCLCAAEVMPWRPLCVVNEFHLSAPQPSPTTLRWSTIDGTAVAGVDYVAVVDKLEAVAPGQTRVTLPVQLLRHTPDTSSRFFQVRVFAWSGGTIVDAVAVFTIDGS